MSINGIAQFDKNLRVLMNSEAFKKADEAQKLNFGYRLFNSKYGIGAFFGFGKVHALPERKT